ncbi:Cna B-type domain-containing protein [Ligilactobacillus saerimneri]|uniref:Cna B-type domain-containing protein n=1 Tax=Ligilactobacillus saerimneri TaxID=228229 RepID=A0A7H9EIJ9_9LACO|nr:Cna B-type domain-containing protein [Ligilactobacillus saerimneri]QLL77528.1 Cna B-type domain-containing protein [Ligilactobacillus saerimneri]
MFSRNNQFEKSKQTANQKPRYALRKLSVGVASVLIGTAFYLGNSTTAHADTTSAPTNADNTEHATADATTTAHLEKQVVLHNSSATTASSTETNSGENATPSPTDQTATPEPTTNTSTVSATKDPSNSEVKATNTPSNSVTTSNQQTQASTANPKNKSTSSLYTANKVQTATPKATARLAAATTAQDINDADTFINAITNAATDGTETVLRLVNDINLGNTTVVIKKGQNIHITNDGQRRTIFLGDQWFVQTGGNLYLDGSYDPTTGLAGIALTRPDGENPNPATEQPGMQLPPKNSGWVTYLDDKNPKAVIAIYGHATFNNVDVHDFFSAAGFGFFPYTPGGTILVVGGQSQLDLTGHTSVRNNTLFDTGITFISAYNYSAGVTYFTYPGTSSQAQGSMGADVVFSNNKIQPVSLPGQMYGKANKQDPQVPLAAGALAINPGCKVDIKGTTFEDNIGGYYGAIMIGGRQIVTLGNYEKLPNAQVTINGAKITGNTGAVAGGGIAIIGLANVTIDGKTEITKNKVGYIGDEILDNPYTRINGTRGGGGLAIFEEPSVEKTNNTHVVLDDVLIDKNISTDVGGGMYINTDGVEIKRAVISNNIANVQGGGIYVGQVPYNLRISNAAIYENQASDNSNGMTFKIGDTIYKISLNTAVKESLNTYQATITNIISGKSTTGTVTIDGSDILHGKLVSVTNPDDPTTVLNNSGDTVFKDIFVGGVGGGIWACPTGDTTINITNGWALFDNTAQNMGADFYHEEKSDGVNVEVHSRALGGSDANWTHDRDAMNGDPLTDATIPDNTGLKSNLSADAKKLAKMLASVQIYGNIAAFGGGIGGNGGMFSGFAAEDSRTKDIVIKKVWHNDSEQDRPDHVLVDVTTVIDGVTYKVTTITLSKANNWQATLKDLPTNIDYQFAEEPVDINGDDIPDYTEEVGNLTKVDSPDPQVDVYNLTLANTKKDKTVTIKVVKHWDDDNETTKRPQAITVDVYQEVDGQQKLVGTVTLDADHVDENGNWVGTITGLPVGATFKLVEATSAGYHVEQMGQLTKIASDAMIDTYEILFVNKKDGIVIVPNEPDEPDKPSEPTKPNQPTPETPTEATPTKDTSIKPKVVTTTHKAPVTATRTPERRLPQTGENDHPSLLALAATMFLSALGLSGIDRKRRKN